MVAANGFIHIIGIGGGTLQTGVLSTQFCTSVRAPYWGARSQLMEVLELAQAGAVTVHVEQFAIEDAVEAYHKLHEATVSGRAVMAF